MLLVAASQLAVSQTDNSQPAATGEADGKSAKLTEAIKLTVQVVKLHGQGKFDEALPLAEQVLKLREEAVGREHQLVGDAAKNLGAVYLAKGKSDKGKQFYLRALSIYEKNAAANNVNLIKLLDALGFLERFAFNNYLAAIEHYERSLALKEKSLGMEHADVVANLYDLTELYELLIQNDKALAVHRRVIGIREKHEAKEPYKLVSALNRFICLSERLGMKTETEEAKQRAEAIRTREDERREREQAEAEARAKENPAGLALPVGGFVRGGVLNGKAISKPQPYYPEVAKRQRISGIVVVSVTVNEQGTVIDAYACGHPLLSEAAVRAAYNARFSPTLLSGHPVKVNGIITYRFLLQ